MHHLQVNLETMSEQKRILRSLANDVINQVLFNLQKLLKENQVEILARNSEDVQKYRSSAQFQKAFVDRLTLTPSRISGMIESLAQVAQSKSPNGSVVEERLLQNGLKVQRVRAPLGLVFLIFEARPNVITEAFSLALKSGNALILKGGKESDRTSEFIYGLIKESLQQAGVSRNAFWGIVGASREETDFLIKQNKFIDVLIPRGGEKLIEYVSLHSNIPIIKNDRGLCHLYVHAEADQEMALKILDNAKTQRPSVCNAIETLLVDESIAESFMTKAYSLLHPKSVEFYVCEKGFKILGGSNNVFAATKDSFDTEYLDLKLSLKVVKDLGSAIDHIEKHGSRHSESIVTRNANIAREFMSNVDAAAVYWNASTRFTDGGQLGLGAEIGISTQKLHVRGPVGLEALTSIRWVIEGEGQVRTT